MILNFYTVLRAICRNPDGQFWAGDTAQTISVGSSFRFDDLKAFLHRNEASYLHSKETIHLEPGFTGTSKTAICGNDRASSAKVFPACHELPFAWWDSEVRSLGHSAHHEILALRDRYLARRERNRRRYQTRFLHRLGSGQRPIRIIPFWYSVSTP
jgi:hypothetical protein